MHQFAHAVKHARKGRHTQFVNVHAAYKALLEPLQRRMVGCRATSTTADSASGNCRS